MSLGHMQFNKKKTISNLLVTLFGGALVCVIVSVAGLVYSTGKKQLDLASMEQVEVISDALTSSIKGYMDKVESSLNLMTGNPQVGAAISALNKVEGKVLGDIGGSTQDADIKELQRQLDVVAATEEAVLHAYLGTSKDKYIKSPVERYGDDYRATQRGWYKSAVESKKVVWTEPYMDYATQKMCITVAAPIMKNGNVISVIGFDLDLAHIADKYVDFKVGEEGFFGLAIPEAGKPGNYRSMYASKDSLKDKMGDVSIVEDNAGDGQIAVKGLNNVLANAPKEIDHDNIDLNKVNIDGTDYQVVVQNDEKINFFKIMAIENKEFKAKAQSLLVATMGTALVVGVISILVLKKLITKIGDMLIKVNNALSKVKEGDLTVQLEGDIIAVEHEAGQLANNLNETVGQVRGLMVNIHDASEELNHAAQELSSSATETNSRIEEIASSMNEIVEGISEQAAAAEQSSATITQLADKLEQLKDSSSAMSNLTDEVKKENEQGLSSVNDLQYYTEQNNKSNSEVSKKINELSKKTESIESIVDTMSQIAEQTNLLALNAAIEAARAGEHGAGFSVVAGEVKKLAEQSSRHAENIRDIVNAIQGDVRESVDVMNQATKIAADQTKAVNTVVETFQIISDSTESMGNSITDIHGFVEVINDDKDTIVEGIEKISIVSQKSAASSQEISASIQEQTALTQSLAGTADKLNELSSKLSEDVSKFEV